MQTKQTFERIGTSVETAGGKLGDIISMAVFTTDMRHVAEFRSVLRELSGDRLPASSCVEVTHRGTPLVPVEPKKLPLVPLDPAIPTNASVVREFRSGFDLK